MRVGLSGYCSNCRFEKHFSVGIGFRHYALEAVIDLIHPRIRKRVLKLLHEHEVHETDYEHRIYRCER
jgi:hypothetical protein